MKHSIQFFILTIVFALSFFAKVEAEHSLRNTKIAFVSDRDGGISQLFVMNIDGTNQHKLTNEGEPVRHPSWSPDGQEIVFQTGSSIKVIHYDGTNLRTLSNSQDLEPSWSKDGMKIAFSSYRDGNWEIYTMNKDGTNLVRLTNNTVEDHNPSWSPDGSKMAFQRYQNVNWEIFTINSSGTNEINITNNTYGDWSPSWSRVSNKIAFVSNRDASEYSDIFYMNDDGSNVVKFTNHQNRRSNAPSWAPDGSDTIVYSSNRDTSAYDNIYINDNRITTTSGAVDIEPDWSPFILPLVIGVTPSLNALSVPKTNDIIATFNVPINTFTLNDNNILVHGSQSGKHSGTITLSGDTSFTFNPTSDFKPGEIVNITLTKNILSASGDSLTNGYHWEFTVQAIGGNAVFTQTQVLHVDEAPGYIIANDIDLDGDIDLIVGNSGSNTLSILRNDGHGRFDTLPYIQAGHSPYPIAVGDIDNNGYDDIVIANASSDTISFLKNNEGTFSRTFLVSNRAHDLTLNDFDGDGALDIAITIPDSHKVVIYKNDGSGNFTQLSYNTFNDAPLSIASCDLNNDGFIDIVITANRNSGSAPAYALKNNGDGTFTQYLNEIGIGNTQGTLVPGDFNSDGLEDVLVPVDGISKVSIIKNNSTSFTETILGYPGQARTVAIGDIDGDGDLDPIVSVFSSSSVALYQNNGGMNFSSFSSINLGAAPWASALADFDGDGDLDIAVTEPNVNSVAILFNDYHYNYGFISGTLFNDINSNGIKDGNDSGLVNWKIILSGAISETTLTNGNGYYYFDSLPAGTFQIKEQLQSRWVQTLPFSPATYSLTLSVGQNDTGKNFGNYQIPASLTGECLPDSNMILLLHCNESEGNRAYDASGNNNHGIATGTSIVSGKFGNARSYPNAGDGIVVREGIIPSFNNDFTIQTWIFPTAYGDDNRRGIFDQRDTTDGTPVIGLTLGTLYGAHGTNVLSVVVRNNAGNLIEYYGSNPLSLNQWSHIALVRDFSNAKLIVYLNGQIDIEANIGSIGTQSGFNVFVVGRNAYSSVNDWFKGNIDEVCVSKKALSEVELGFQYRSSISGNVFNDLNGNGIKDEGDSGLVNWEIQLSGTVRETTFTNANGYYIFSNLPLGAYDINEEVQVNWIRFSPQTGSYHLVVDSSENLIGKDFGNFHLASICGKKYHDLNGNGQFDSGEPGLFNWQITLKKSDGATIDTTATDSSGNYSFSSVTSGKYIVREIQQGGWIQTSVNSDTITITSGSTITGINFGNGHRSSICGVKYDDDNGNGQRDDGEPGLQGWTIILSGTSNATLQTDPSGTFCFTNLSAGYYMLNEAPQNGWKQTQGGYSIQLSSGKDTLCNFGDFRYGSISGMMFNDLNGDSVKQLSEPPLSNWNVSLWKSGQGAPFAVRLTASDGSYRFDSMMSGNYYLYEETRKGWIQTIHPIGYLTITSGSIFTNQNFGNVFGLSMDILAKWNMVSLPIGVLDNRKSIVFPNAISSAFSFEESYQSKTTLLNGNGYWLKFDSAQTINLIGDVIAKDTINVSAGWNMIGSISDTISVSCIVPVGTSIQSSYFGYQNGYVSSDIILPGKAYWVKVSNDGQLILKSCVMYGKIK